MQLHLNCKVTLPTDIIKALTDEFGLGFTDGKIIIGPNNYKALETIITEYVIMKRVSTENARIEELAQKRVDQLVKNLDLGSKQPAHDNGNINQLITLMSSMLQMTQLNMMQQGFMQQGGFTQAQPGVMTGAVQSQTGIGSQMGVVPQPGVVPGYMTGTAPSQPGIVSQLRQDPNQEDAKVEPVIKSKPVAKTELEQEAPVIKETKPVGSKLTSKQLSKLNKLTFG